MKLNLRFLLIALFLPVIAASTGAFFKPGTWYDYVLKPSWTPPNFIFPMVWGFLYVFMGFTFYSLLKNSKIKEKEGKIYFIILLLNALWSPIFFGAHLLWPGAFIIFLMLIGMASFLLLARKNKLILFLNSFYFLWLLIAFSLNIFIALNNGPVKNVEDFLDDTFENFIQGDERKAFVTMSVMEVSSTTRDGYHRLDINDLYRWNKLRYQMTLANQEFCSQLWRGGATSELMYRAMKDFSRAQLVEWAALSGKAYKKGLNKTSPRVLTILEARDALINLSKSLGKKERENFLKALGANHSFDRNSSCWVLRIILRTIDRNKDKNSENALYFLAKQLSLN